jgi:4-hydroxybutyrate CoA-transferase
MGWIEAYREKRRSAEEAVKCIRSGDCVYLHAGGSNPETLVRAMVGRASELRDVRVVHLLTAGSAEYVRPEMAASFHHVALFAGPNVRDAINEGRADFVPIFLSEVEALFSSGAMPIDVALIHVTPPDEHGFCSFGVSIDSTKTACERARIVIAQVNSKMPRTLGDCFIHVNKIRYVVEVDDELPEFPMGKVSENALQIGKKISNLIEDGSTLQLGIGEIPDAVLSYLIGKKDLGIHSEMVSDGVIDLIEKGIITNEKKTLHPGKVIIGFVLGTRRLYDFIDNNPIFEFHPSQYTNDPFIIAHNDSQVAINSAIEVDLTGQVCADSIGYRYFSGFGGQLDFIRQADHCPVFDRGRWNHQPHRPALAGRGGRRHHARRRSLRGDGIWDRIPARQDAPRKMPGFDRDRTPEIQRGARTPGGKLESAVKKWKDGECR